MQCIVQTIIIVLASFSDDMIDRNFHRRKGVGSEGWELIGKEGKGNGM